ncbi:histone protein, partial [Streptomyces sp. NPDC002917]
MNDANKILLAAALAGGYVLGRTKKGRFALTAASYIAGRQFGLEPRQLVVQGIRKLGEIPQVADLGEQLRGEVMNAGREAVTAAANRRLTTLADSLRERTLQLESGEEEPEEEEEEEEEGEEPEEEYEEEEEPEEGEEQEPEEEYEEGEYEEEEEPEEEEGEEEEPEEEEEEPEEEEPEEEEPEEEEPEEEQED